MEKKDIDWRRVNPIFEEYLDPLCKSKLHVNYVGFENNCSPLHEERKANECLKEYIQNKLFLTNPTLKNRKKPDIMLIPLEDYNPYFKEIAVTEKEYSLDIKKEIYRLPVEVVRV